VFFVKKKWTFPQRSIYSISIFYFTYLGGTYSPNAPPCLRAWSQTEVWDFGLSRRWGDPVSWSSVQVKRASSTAMVPRHAHLPSLTTTTCATTSGEQVVVWWSAAPVTSTTTSMTSASARKHSALNSGVRRKTAGERGPRSDRPRWFWSFGQSPRGKNTVP